MSEIPRVGLVLPTYQYHRRCTILGSYQGQDCTLPALLPSAFALIFVVIILLQRIQEGIKYAQSICFSPLYFEAILEQWAVIMRLSSWSYFFHAELKGSLRRDKSKYSF